LQSEAVRKRAQNPFGGFFDTEAEKFAKARHVIEEGMRVRVNAPSHESHGHTGRVAYINNAGHIGIKLDSGHEVQCLDSEVVPEDFEDLRGTGGASTKVLSKGASRNVDDLIEAAIEGLRAGKNIIMPPECRPRFARVPVLQKMVEAGRICFDWR
jgi:hypothetical protein